MFGSKEVIVIVRVISGLGIAIPFERLLGYNNFTVYEKTDNIDDIPSVPATSLAIYTCLILLWIQIDHPCIPAVTSFIINSRLSPRNSIAFPNASST